MNYLQYKRLREAAAQVHELKDGLVARMDELEKRQFRQKKRLDAMHKLLEHALNRRPGRPSRDDVRMVDGLLEILNEQTH